MRIAEKGSRIRQKENENVIHNMKEREKRKVKITKTKNLCIQIGQLGFGADSLKNLHYIGMSISQLNLQTFLH